MNVTTCFTYQHSSHKTCFFEANPNRPPTIFAWFFLHSFTSWNTMEYSVWNKNRELHLGSSSRPGCQWTVTCLLGMLRIPLNKHVKLCHVDLKPFPGSAKQSVPTTYAVVGTRSSGHSALISWTMSDREETSKVNCWTKLSYIFSYLPSPNPSFTKVRSM